MFQTALTLVENLNELKVRFEELGYKRIGSTENFRVTAITN